MQPLKTLKPFELIYYLASQETVLKVINVIGSFAENVVIGQSFCKCPGLSVCTVILHFYFHYVFSTVIESKFLGFIEKIRGLRRYI